MELTNFYTDVNRKLPKEMIRIIDWYLSTFSYRRIKTVYLSGGIEYIDIPDSNIMSLRASDDRSRHSIKFVFESLEDKILFDLTWG